MIEESSTGNSVTLSTDMGPGWEIAARGDFDRDGREDLLWRNVVTGANRMWFEVGQNPIEDTFEDAPDLAHTDVEWVVLASGDFDGDGYFDVFWQNSKTLATNVWFMDATGAEVVDFPRMRSASWVLEASADFDGSDTDDLFWRNLNDGRTAFWLMDGQRVEFAASETSDLDLEIVNLVDHNQDNSMDLVWQDSAGNCEIWLMSGGERIADPSPIGAPTCPSLE